MVVEGLRVRFEAGEALLSESAFKSSISEFRVHWLMSKPKYLVQGLVERVSRHSSQAELSSSERSADGRDFAAEGKVIGIARAAGLSSSLRMCKSVHNDIG